MRYIGAASFVATICVFVPLIQPNAGPNERAKLVAADIHDVVIDGTQVTATIEHPFGEPDAPIQLTLHADKEVQVGIVVLGSTGTEGDRVPAPPRPVTHRTVTLIPDRRTGQATKDVTVRLHNARANGYHPYGTYTLYITSREIGDRLEKLVDRAGPSIPTGEIPDMDRDTSKLFSTIYALDRAARSGDDDGDDDKMFAKGSVAVLHAFTRPVNDELELKLPERAARGEGFTVAVTVRNPTNAVMNGVKVALDVMRFEEDDYLGLASSDVAIDEAEPITLAAHARKTVQLHVSAQQVGLLGLRASATCDECARSVEREMQIGTFDAIEVKDPGAKVAKQ